ncbi:Protoglobin-domain-containing protein [Melampsora americana]|nr:Protoglobin-domain-containing protein [Melampsora americana]
MDPHTVTRSELNGDLEARVNYMKDFLEFTDEDCEIMKAVRPIAKPLVPEIVASAYNKLLSYECCKIAFFPRKDGAQGTHGTLHDLVGDANAITIDSATIRIRRNILEKWAMKIFTSDYNEMEIFEFFNRIGIQHVGGARVFSAGKKKPLFVDYIHLAMTLGYITDRMTAAILTLPESTWPLQKKTRAVRAFHKIGWIHNDLLARHHTEEAGTGSTFSSPLCSSSAVFAGSEHITTQSNPNVAGADCCPMREDSLEAGLPMPAVNGTTGSCFSNYRTDSGWDSEALSARSNYPNPCEPPPTARLMDSHSQPFSSLGFERTYSANETDHPQMHSPPGISKGDYSTWDYRCDFS